MTGMMMMNNTDVSLLPSPLDSPEEPMNMYQQIR